jgi:transposase
VVPAVATGRCVRVFRPSAAMRGGHGGLCRGAPLGPVLATMGHTVRLIPAREVKPFVRLPKTDASDAAAIAEAARRPELRRVPVKTEACQAVCSAHRARDQLMRRRTSLINALRAHLAEFGITAPAGEAGRTRLFAQVRGQEMADLPELLCVAVQGLLETIEAIERSISAIEQGLSAAANADAAARRLQAVPVQAVPGIGRLTASALVAFAGDARRFESARQFVAWLGLAPRVRRAAVGRGSWGLPRAGPSICAGFWSPAIDPRGAIPAAHRSGRPRSLVQPPPGVPAASGGDHRAGGETGPDRLGSDGPRGGVSATPARDLTRGPTGEDENFPTGLSARRARRRERSRCRQTALSGPGHPERSRSPRTLD